MPFGYKKDELVTIWDLRPAQPKSSLSNKVIEYKMIAAHEGDAQFKMQEMYCLSKYAGLYT